MKKINAYKIEIGDTKNPNMSSFIRVFAKDEDDASVQGSRSGVVIDVICERKGVYSA